MRKAARNRTSFYSNIGKARNVESKQPIAADRPR